MGDQNLFDDALTRTCTFAPSAAMAQPFMAARRRGYSVTLPIMGALTCETAMLPRTCASANFKLAPAFESCTPTASPVLSVVWMVSASSFLVHFWASRMSPHYSRFHSKF